MARGAGAAARIDWARVPLLPGVQKLAARGHITGASARVGNWPGVTVDLMGAKVVLGGASVELVDLPNREGRLRAALERLGGDYDFILIDCPPSLSLLTVNALTAADSLLIPLQCEFYALEGLGQLLQTVKRVKRALNPDLAIAGILLTMFDRRTNLSHQVAEEANTYFKGLVFKTAVPRNIRLGEAPSFGKAVLFHDKDSRGALAYLALAGELIRRDEEAAFATPADAPPGG